MTNEEVLKKLQTSARILVTLGVPIAAAVTFPDAVLKRPMRTTALLVVYELLLILVGFFKRVGTILESRWAEKVAAAIADTIEAPFSSVRIPQYLRQLIDRHRAIDMKGLLTRGIYTLQMEQVFVDLSIVPQAIHNVSSHVLGTIGAVVANRRYSILDLLTAKQMPFLSMAILGPPGSGKTTLLKHLTLTFATKRMGGRHRTIPVLLLLREHADKIAQNPRMSLLDLVDISLSVLGYPTPVRWLHRRIRKGWSIVLLDGLDEIPDVATRRTVANWIDRQIEMFALTRFIVTSRPYGYKGNPLAQVTVLEVRPFNAAQVVQFVRNWYLANEIMAAGNTNDAGVQMAAKADADDLIARLRKAPDLAELAVNPLLLTMIANVHRFRSSLPRKRVELYEEMCGVFLGIRDEAKGIERGNFELTAKQKQRVLEPLAFEMMMKNTREIGRTEALKLFKDPLVLFSDRIEPNEFMKNVEQLSGVLLERENSVYSFAHLTFQEYLAACHIRWCNLEQDVLKYIDLSWWHEVLRLYSAQADASEIIGACLAAEKPSIEALTLATQCMEEAFLVRPEIRSRLDVVLAATASGDDARRLLARQRLKLRIRKLLRNESNWLLDDSLITSAEFQLFLDESPREKLSMMPDHWLNRDLAAGNPAMPVDGVRADAANAFCEWLTTTDGTTCIFRLPTVSEAEAGPLYLSSQGSPLYYWVSDSEQRTLIRAREAEMSLPAADLITVIENDLRLVLHDHLELASAFELTKDEWQKTNLPNEVFKEIGRRIHVGPTIDLNRIYELAIEARNNRDGDCALATSALPQIVFAAAGAALGGASADTSAWDQLFTLALGTFAREKPSSKRGENLVRLLISFLITKSPAWVAWSRKHAKLARNASHSGDGSLKIWGAAGAPLQGMYHRAGVARNLMVLFSECPWERSDRAAFEKPEVMFVEHRRGAKDERSYEGRLINNSDLNGLHRSATRLLIVATSWFLLRQHCEKIESVVGNTEWLGPYVGDLLQILIDLCIFEQRISGVAPAVESIRIARETRTDSLAIAYAGEHNTGNG